MAASLRSVFRSILYSQSKIGITKTNQAYYASDYSAPLRHFSDIKTEEKLDEKLDSAGIDGQEQDKKEPDPKKKIRQIVPVETSIRYMESSAYNGTYGDNLVWKEYRRNFKGPWAPRKTRKSCIRGGIISTGNPCPICRDEYLVLDYTNLKLIKQFISPITGQIFEATKTGVCRKQQAELQVAILKAKDYGYLTFEVPHRTYNYEEYYTADSQKTMDIKE